MYLFSRQARLAPGNQTAGFDWAINIGELVHGVTGMQVELWTTVLSPGVGTVAWTTWAPDLATLENSFDKLLADPGYIAAVDKGSAFIAGGADDNALSIVHGEADPARHITYVGVVSAVLASGHAAEGLGVAVEIAQLASEITGETTLVAMPVAGSWGSVEWMTGYEDIAHMEAAQQKLMADPRWLGLIDDKAKHAFVEEPAATQQLVYRKIA